jgi:malQ: 4-alpha-glucanotransferase
LGRRSKDFRLISGINSFTHHRWYLLDGRTWAWSPSRRDDHQL